MNRAEQAAAFADLARGAGETAVRYARQGWAAAAQGWAAHAAHCARAALALGWRRERESS